MGPPSGNRWTPEEDRTLKTLVAKHGPRWKTVAHAMRTKTDSQCARRWENRSVPRKPRDWTAKEDLVLVAGHKLMGKRWKRIASRIGSRSADAARNRWASLVKRMPLLEKNHEYDAGLAQAEASGQEDGSVCTTETESRSSQGVSTCHQDSCGTALSPDTSTLTSRSPTARQARSAQLQRLEAVAALAPMTPSPRASLLPHGAVPVMAEDPSPVKIEAPIDTPAAAPAAACKREPPTPRWRPEDSRVCSYAQASLGHEDARKYERHASINPMFKTHHTVPAVCADLVDWPSMAPPAHMAGPLPAEADADFDAVDWIPACITGGEAGLWRGDWHGPDHGLSMLPCAYW